VLTETVERIATTAPALYTDIPRGVFLLRGENIVFLGEVDPVRESTEKMRYGELEDVLRAQTAEKEHRERQRKATERLMRQRGDISEMESEAY
jgi:U6 snRNA-associated Sm-like protein LSm1